MDQTNYRYYKISKRRDFDTLEDLVEYNPHGHQRPFHLYRELEEKVRGTDIYISAQGAQKNSSKTKIFAEIFDFNRSNGSCDTNLRLYIPENGSIANPSGLKIFDSDERKLNEKVLKRLWKTHPFKLIALISLIECKYSEYFNVSHVPWTSNLIAVRTNSVNKNPLKMDFRDVLQTFPEIFN